MVDPNKNYDSPWVFESDGSESHIDCTIHNPARARTHYRDEWEPWNCSVAAVVKLVEVVDVVAVVAARKKWYWRILCMMVVETCSRK